MSWFDSSLISTIHVLSSIPKPTGEEANACLEYTTVIAVSMGSKSG